MKPLIILAIITGCFSTVFANRGTVRVNYVAGCLIPGTTNELLAMAKTGAGAYNNLLGQAIDECRGPARLDNFEVGNFKRKSPGLSASGHASTACKGKLIVNFSAAATYFCEQ